MKANSIPRPIDGRLKRIRINHYGIVQKSGEAVPGELRQIKERLLNTNEKGIEEGNRDNKQPYGLDLSGGVRKLGLRLLKKRAGSRADTTERPRVVFRGLEKLVPKDPFETAGTKTPKEHKPKLRKVYKGI